MIEIPLSNGGVALIDDADYDLVAPFKWRWIKPRRNLTRLVVCANPGQIIYMHRLIMGAKKGDVIDHINRDTQNNQRSNLRFATHALNAANKGKRANAVVPFKGVTWRKDNGLYRARIRVDGKLINLGHFASAEPAARAYDVAARLHFGVFAAPNFPPGH